MNFRLAREEDKDIVLKLYDAVRGTEFCTWDSNYPTDFEINEDYSTGNLYVLDDNNEVIGAVSINPVNENDDYDDWKIESDAGEFSRVVIRPDHQGEGLSLLLVENVIEEIRSRGKKTVHITVAKKNIPAQKLYKRLGFEFLSEVSAYGSDYYICEKTL